MFFDKRYASTELINPDFVTIASGYGIPAKSVSDRGDLKDSLREMLDSKGPYILNVSIDKEANVLPMVEPGASVSEITLTYK
jgi:acetolactate synthase-1/2/3 large subunit